MSKNRSISCSRSRRRSRNLSDWSLSNCAHKVKKVKIIEQTNGKVVESRETGHKVSQAWGVKQ